MKWDVEVKCVIGVKLVAGMKWVVGVKRVVGVESGFFLLSFRRKMVKRSPPEEIFVKRSPPEPEKIARYLVLSAQKKAKNRGSKKFTP